MYETNDIESHTKANRIHSAQRASNYLHTAVPAHNNAHYNFCIHLTLSCRFRRQIATLGERSVQWNVQHNTSITRIQYWHIWNIQQ